MRVIFILNSSPFRKLPRSSTSLFCPPSHRSQAHLRIRGCLPGGHPPRPANRPLYQHKHGCSPRHARAGLAVAVNDEVAKQIARLTRGLPKTKHSQVVISRHVAADPGWRMGSTQAEMGQEGRSLKPPSPPIAYWRQICSATLRSSLSRTRAPYQTPQQQPAMMDT